MMAAFRAYNPAQARLLDSLNASAQDQVDAGASLDPSMQRTVSQATRAGQAARGMGNGMQDLSQEILNTGYAGQDMRNQRLAYASNVLGQNRAAYGDPLQATLGRSSAVPTAMSMAGAGGGMASSAGAPIFNPGVNPNDVYSSNYNAAYSTRAANANTSAALAGGTMSMFGTMAGSGIIAGAL